MPQPLLSIRELRTYFYTAAGVAKAVDGVSLDLARGEALGLVGESGCGKTVLALSVLGLVPRPGKIVDGRILFKDKDLTRLSARELERVRGNHISMIFQEPMTSLNPVLKIGDQIAEVIILHQKKSKKQAMDMAAELLGLVGIPEPEKRLKSYPHHLSGGMRQRVMIAMALACDPDLILADEPTTALDVTIQAQILDLMMKLKAGRGLSVMLITHDLGVVAETCARVAVMYSGKVVEQADVQSLFKQPLHPYTQGLLASLPRVDVDGKHRLNPIPGIVPDLLHLPPGCKFHPRCPQVFDRCRAEEPSLISQGDGRAVRCWLYD